MNRTVVSWRDATGASVGIAKAASVSSPDKYVDRLLKYIPPDVIGVFLATEGLIRAAGPEEHRLLSWIVFATILILTPFYLARVGGVTKPVQIAISTLAFVVWAFAYNGPPFSLLGVDALYPTVILALYTFLVPLFEA